jgi:hypothetical protein
MTSAVGATWVTKPGHLPNISVPIFEGVAPTIQVTSTECGNDCAFINPKMYATAAVSAGDCCGRPMHLQPLPTAQPLTAWSALFCVAGRH